MNKNWKIVSMILFALALNSLIGAGVVSMFLSGMFTVYFLVGSVTASTAFLFFLLGVYVAVVDAKEKELQDGV